MHSKSEGPEPVFQFPRVGLIVKIPGRDEYTMEWDDPRVGRAEHLLEHAPEGTEVIPYVTQPGVRVNPPSPPA